MTTAITAATAKNPPDPVRARIENIQRLAVDAFAEHQLKEVMRSGIFRSWRCQRPKSSCYLFDVTTTPGHLIVTGDLQCYCFTREWDMIDWLRKSIKDLHYMAGKCEAGKTREYDPEVAKAWLLQEAKDYRAIEGERDRARAALDMLREDRVFEDGRDMFYAALADAGLDHAETPTSWENWNCQYLWIHSALAWFIKTLDAGNITQPEYVI